jgi:hypothetical protein
MLKGYQTRQPLTEKQASVWDNLKAQNKLRAELAWLEARADLGTDAAARRVDQIKIGLATLKVQLALP